MNTSINMTEGDKSQNKIKELAFSNKAELKSFSNVQSLPKPNPNQDKPQGQSVKKDGNSNK